MKRLFAVLVTAMVSLCLQAQDFSQGRCATPTPALRAAMFGPSDSLIPSDCSSSSTNPSTIYNPGDVYEIDVVVHVITNGSTGYISDAMVASQIDILNEDFLAEAGTNGEDGTYSGIRFRLATVDPSGNPTNGITRHNNSTWFNDGGSYYNTINWDPDRYLNIYTNNGGGALGYVPALPADGNGSIVGTAADRVVILWNTFGRNAPNSPFNLGRTATHEVGHFLGLEHTFNGGCSSAGQPACFSSGDLICDTLPESSPNYGNCSGSNPNTCGDADPITNYMDYSDDACMDRFTTQQMRRMRCTLESWRPNLINLGTGTNNPPTASFTTSISGLTVAFTSTSSDSDGTIVSHAWNFGDGSTSSAQNPTHTYSADGTYTVTLTVTDDEGATGTTSAPVSVSGTTSGNELTSGVPVTNLSGSTGEWQMFFIDVPAGASRLTVTIGGGSGDADMYVRYGSEPTTSAYNCRPYRNGNNETCTIDNPQAGLWFVGLRAYSNYSGVTLTATVEETSGCTPYSNTINGISGTTGWKYYTVNVPECADVLTVTISGGSGDADLYVRQGAQPTTSSYNCRPYLNGNNETCTINNPAAATWHIGIRAYSAYSNVSLTVAYQ